MPSEDVVRVDGRVVVSLNLDPELARQLDAFVATKPGENRTSVATKALGQYLRRYARKPAATDELDEVDLALGELAKQRMDDPHEQVVPYAEARARLGL
jgi:hypothetical protein